jgi:hypothetical protein
VESRTRLAIGGMATVAASVTVICIVALTNSVALSESAGSPVDAAPVVVPASGAGDDEDRSTPSATPKPSPTPTPLLPDAQTPANPRTSPPVAEVVPAPEAQIVIPTQPAPAAEQPNRPSAGSTPSTPSSLDAAIAQAEATGSWAPVRAWAARQGWSAGRTDALIAKLERAQEDERLEVESDRKAGAQAGADSSLVQGGTVTERVQAPATNIDDDDRGTVAGSSKERPANAGANAGDRSERPAPGAKKDRSRDSPERRDR